MLDKLRNHRGSVSVFLVIVLVPMITCASLFVDASRVKSARGLVNSAGDLTLNTVLSQYDVDLNDFYGLMASAQDMDDVINAAGDYFTACIKSQGIDTTDAAKYINSIKGYFFGDDDVKDLLGIDLADDSTVTVTPVTDGSLTNPALVKTQIVEFMKYRSPINSIVALFEKFKQSATELENSSKSADLVDKKQEYYEAQGDVAKKAYDIYLKIVEYQNLGITGSDLQEIKDYIQGLETRYKNLHIKMVKDLYNTQGTSSGSIQRANTIPTQYSHQSKYNNSSTQQIKKQVDSLLRAYDQFITARSNFENNIKSWPTSGNQYYDIQYWAYCCKNSSYFTNVVNKENNMKNSFINLWDMIEHAAEGALDEQYTCTYTSSNLSITSGVTTKSLQDWFDFIKPKVYAAGDSVAKSGTKYNTCVNKVLNCTNVYDRISTTTTNNELAEIYNKLNDYATRYQKGLDLLTEIYNGLIKDGLFSKSLRSLVIEADNKFETWGNKADEYSSTGIKLAENDQAEINTIKSEQSKLKTADIDDYSLHINNVKSALGTVTTGLKKISYNGQSIINKNINGYNAFKRNSDVLESEIPMYTADLEQYANSSFHFSMEGVEIQSLNFTDNNDPNIAQTKYAVYEWMIDQGFRNPIDENDPNKKQYDELKKKKDDQADSADTDVASDVASKNDISGLSDLPSGTSSDLDAGKISTKVKDVSEFVGNLFKNFGSTVSQAGVDIRDDLFVLDYITSMFTWQTYEYEAKYNMLDKSQQKDINYDTAPDVYKGKNTEWQSKEGTQKYNKTITNKLRNSEATNWSYCNEVEYIMYGKDIEGSKSALNGSIFMIRFAMNIPVIFSIYYSLGNDQGKQLDTFAKLVNTATHGIVPAGLVKVIVCLGLTALESAKDLNTLKNGIPVILVKTGEDDLFVTSWGFTSRNNPETDKTSAVTFSYSDYMKLILFLKLLGSEAYNIYGRIADVVQTNMSKCVLKDDGFLLSKSQVYYSITANVKVKPLMLNTSYVLSFFPDGAQRMDSWNGIEYKSIRGY